MSELGSLQFGSSTLTFLSSRFLIIFFIGWIESFTSIAGLTRRISTILTSSRRSVLSSPYNSFNLAVLSSVDSSVTAYWGASYDSLAPIIGLYRV